MRFLLSFLTVFVLGASCGRAQLFSDNFSRATDPGPLSPWIAKSGSWAVTGGQLAGGTNAANSFCFLYVTNMWSNYSVQARVRFSTVNADGGGISGRFNPFSGGQYAVWISPEGSGDSNTLQIAKFQYWYSYEYTNTTWQQMQKVPLASVGTNWHALRLDFQGNQISVYYDSNLVASATDLESNPYLTGGIGVGMSTVTAPFNMFVDDVIVTPLSTVLMAQNDRFYVAQNGSLTVPAPGVMTNDTAGANPNIWAIRLSNTTKGTLTFNTNGGFNYVPSNGFVGIDTFTYQVTDGVSTSAWVTAAIDVLPSTNIFYDNFTRAGTTNAFAPWVTGLGEWSVSGGTLLGTGTAFDYYSDAYIPGVWGDFSVQERFQLPAGAWACGISGRVNPVTGERYVANVYPENSPYPSGPTPGLRLIKFHSWGTWNSSYTAMAVAPLSSVGTGFHTLKMVCYGNTIDIYYDGTRAIHAIDDNVDGIPFYRSGAFGAHMYMYTSYTATFDDYNASLIAGINYPPVLPVQTDRSMTPLTALLVTNTATDVDVPANVLTYTLATAPSGATINTNGVISWTPSLAQDLSTNLFTTIVTDSNPSATNSQHLSATNSFSVIVNSHAVVVLDSTALLAEGCSPPNGAIDSGENVTVLFALKNTGASNTTNLVATLLSTGGVTSPSGPQTYGVLTSGGLAITQAFSFSASTPCGGTLNATFQLQDGPTSLGNLVVPFVIGQTGQVYAQNFDSVTAPALPAGWTTSSSGAQSNWVTQTITNNTAPNCAFSPDVVDIGVNQLISPSIALPNGPCQLSFSQFYDLETNTPTEAFDGAVLEIKVGSSAFTDILAAGGSFVTNGYNYPISTNWGNPLGGRQAWSGTSPGFIRTVVNLPVSTGGQNVQFQWRCGTDNGNGRSGWRVDSVAVTGMVCCTNSANNNTPPILTVPANQIVNELTPLNVSASATDSDIPPQALTFSLLSPPAGMTINPNTGAISWTPTEAQGPSTNIITVVVTDNGSPNLSATNSFTVTVNEVNTAPILTVPANQVINELTTLSVSASATDSDIPANTLTFSLLSPPAGMTINPNTGAISWTPTEAQGPSTNIITVVVTDNGSPNLSATNSFTVTVNEVNSAPVLTVPANQVINELTTLNVSASATDSDIPANTLTFSLLSPPAGMNINPSTGAISWTPTEAQGPSTNTITVRVTDNGSPNLSATNSFTVTVNEVNSAPVLTVPGDQTISELTTLNVSASATDSDIPTNTLTFSFVSAPSGMTINTNTGAISWTPTEAQGPSTNTITVRVTDNGSPPLSDTKSFKVTVNEVNSAPVLPPSTNYTINELTTLTVTNTATDSDIPANALAYLLLAPPAHASIDTNGVITFTPDEGQGPGVYALTTVVTDNGTPNLRATNTVTVTVNEVNSAPVLPPSTNYTINELTTLTATNTATDSDIPANVLTYSLVAPPAHASISTNGIITFSPDEAQGPGVYALTTVVTDNGTPNLSATNTLTVTVNEVNTAPVLTVPANQVINELTTLNVSASATDLDIPANTLTFSLLSPPAGMTINPNTGAISWTPTEAQGPSTNTITVVVTDNGSPNLSATNSFTVTVNEVNSPPVLTVPTNQVVNELATLTVSASATDSDIPANTLTFSLLSPPAGMTINPNTGLITWTPSVLQSPSTNTIIVVVTDNGSPNLSDTNSFVIIVNDVYVPPSLIQNIQISGGQAILNCLTTSNHIYRLQYKDNFADPNWTDVSPDVTANGSVLMLTNTLNSSSHRLYRLYRVH
jgi:hypothetical protein